MGIQNHSLVSIPPSRRNNQTSLLEEGLREVIFRNENHFQKNTPETSHCSISLFNLLLSIYLSLSPPILPPQGGKLKSAFRSGLSLLILLIFIAPVFSQRQKIADLSPNLKEISGLTFLNDSVLVTHNDSGNEPVLYFLNLKGEEIHSVKVTNAKNIDWEDITSDHKGTIYIGDIGNNKNDRTDLCIYKINNPDLLTIENVTAEIIGFNYPDQSAFPPKANDLHFDSEAIAFHNDSLYVFTKCRSNPWDGVSNCYSVPTRAGNYTATKRFSVVIGRKGWIFDSVTGAEMTEEKCYLLTYNRLITYSITSTLNFENKTSLLPIKQFEAVAIDSKGQLFLANEERKFFGGPSLYILK